jgi:hypothetical protein
VKEETVMECGWKSIQLLDYLYGALPANDAKRFEQHQEACPACREEIAHMKPLLQALDTVEGAFKEVRTITIDDRGMPVEYDWSSTINDSGETMTKQWWGVNMDLCIEYAMLQHQDVVLEMLPCNYKQYLYQAPLPTPVPPGAACEMLLVSHLRGPARWAERVGDDRWRYRLETSPNTGREWVFLLTVRLPEGARLLVAEPAPTEVKTLGARPILTWRAILEARPHPQFACSIESQHTPKPGTPVEEHPPTITAASVRPESECTLDS